MNATPKKLAQTGQQAMRPYQHAWLEALGRVKGEISHKDFPKFLATHDYDTFVLELTVKQQKLTRKWSVVMSILGPVFNVLRAFERAVSTCVQSNPEIACLIWGSIQALLIVASKFSDCLQQVSNMLSAISKSMPRFEDYVRYFPSHERLHLRLIDIYETFILFCARAFKFFDSKPFSILAKVLWKSLDTEFQGAVQRLKSDGVEMENEARAASIEIGFKRERDAETRHQEIVGAVSSAIQTTKFIKPAMLVPYGRNPKFYGREQEINDMHNYFMLSKPSVDKGLRVIAIRGLGGLGKSQLALEYIYRYRERYKGIFWLRAEETAVLQQDFAQIGRAVDTGDVLGQDLNKSVEVAKDWLCATDEPWVLVFDNVDNVADVENLWPYAGYGAIILTTRDRDVADKLSQKQIKLAPFNSQEGSTLLLRHMESSGLETQTSRDIVDELGGLPLALCQMGVYMQQTGCSMEEFLQLLRDRLNSRLLFADTASTASLQYANTVASCCSLSIGLLSAETKQILSVLAFFQTDDIQETLITDTCTLIPWLQHLDNRLQWNDAVRSLAKHGLVTRSEKQPGKSLWMHRVVKRHVLHELDSGDISVKLQVSNSAAELLAHAFPSRPLDGGTMCKDWSECERWLPHVLSLKEAFGTYIPDSEIPVAYAELLCNCTYYLWERGITHSLAFASEALGVCQKVKSELDTDVLQADMLTMVGALKLMKFSTRGECADLFRQALELRQRYTDKTKQPTYLDQLQLANAFNNTGAGHLVIEEYDEALPLFQKGLDVKLSLGDETTMPYEMGISFYNLCQVQIGKGMFQEAKEKAYKAWKLVEGKNGPEDFRSNQFRYTYAELLVACGELEQGLRVHEHTLAIRERVMGLDNNDTACSYYGLSCLYQRLSRLDEALDKINYAIRVFHEISDAEDRTARSYYRKHLILKDLGRDADASDALQSARYIRMALTGGAFPGDDSIHAYNSLVAYYYKV